MSWSPISLAPLQYQNEAADGTFASGYVLKAYAAGTTTNIPMATDNTGSTTFNDIVLNASGRPEHSGAEVIPHIDQNYKLSLFATQAAADANTPAVWSIDNLKPSASASAITVTDATNSGVTDVLSVEHQTTGVPAAGIGTGILFKAETASNNVEEGASIEAVTTDVSDASEDFDLVFKVMTGGATRAEVARFNSSTLILNTARGLTAGTTQTQGGATAMTASINEFSTVANTDDGGKLPSDTGIGERVMVVNNGANDMQVWPASGDSIDDGATDAVDPNKLAAGESRVYTRQTATKWTSPAQAGAGALETSSATDITFTAASVDNHSITMTAANKSVILPDATTLQNGAEYLVHCTISSNALTVENDSNAMIATLQPGDTNLIRLIDNSTAAGTWIARDLPYPDLVSFGEEFTDSATVDTYIAAARLSDTKAVRTWFDGSNIQACVVNSDGTAGSAIIIDATSLGYVDVCAMTSTTALIGHCNSSNNDVAVSHVTVDGNTLTLDATDDNTALSVLNEVGIKIAKSGTNKAIVGYRSNNTPDNIIFAAVTVSGTTPTVAASGSALTFNTGTGEADSNLEFRMQQSVNSKVLVGFEDGSGNLDTIALTDADPPVQSGSLSQVLNDGEWMDLIPMDNDMFILAGVDNGSGDDLSISVFGVDATDGDYDSGNATNLVNTAMSSNTRYLRILKTSGTTAIVTAWSATSNFDVHYYVVSVPDGTASNAKFLGPYYGDGVLGTMQYSVDVAACGPMGNGKALFFNNNDWQIVELTEGLL